VKHSHLFGFTLIEVLIVMGIVAILAAIAFPSYTEQVRKSRRIDAMNGLHRIQLAQEQWRANHTAYTAVLMGDNCGNTEAADNTGLCMSGTSERGYYTLAIAAASATGFTATATPAGKQADDRCGTFAVSQDGLLTSGYDADAECWRR